MSISMKTTPVFFLSLIFLTVFYHRDKRFTKQIDIVLKKKQKIL